MNRPRKVAYNVRREDVLVAGMSYASRDGRNRLTAVRASDIFRARSLPSYLQNCALRPTSDCRYKILGCINLILLVVECGVLPSKSIPRPMR